MTGSFVAKHLGSFTLPEAITRQDLGLILLLGAGFFISRYDFALLTLALPDIQAEFGITERELGPFLAWSKIGAVAAIPIALLADRLGRRRMLLVTILGFTIFTVASGLAPNARFFAAFQFAARAFTAAEEVLAVVVAVEAISPAARGWAVGVLAAMGGLGDGLAATVYPLSSMLPYGWRSLYVACGVAVLVVVIARRQMKETQHFQSIATDDASRPGELLRRIATSHHGFWPMTIVTILFHIPIAASLGLMSKYLQQTHGYDQGAVSLLFVAAGAFALLGNILGGSLSDRIGRRGAFTLSLLTMAGGLAAFYSTAGAWLPVAWTIGLFGFLSAHAIFMSFSSELFPTVARATASSLMLGIGSLAAGAGLWLQGQLYQLTEDHASAVLWLLLSLLLAGACTMLLRETRGRVLEDY